MVHTLDNGMINVKSFAQITIKYNYVFFVKTPKRGPKGILVLMNYDTIQFHNTLREFVI